MLYTPAVLHLVGSTVDGRFELLRLAGRGGMGAVYEAIERGLDRRCAVKLLISTDAPKAKRRFLREAKLTAKISHPGVVNVFAQGTDPKTGFPYIAMEYLDGESLDQTLGKGPLSWARTKHIVLQVCRALEAAHEKGIVHRDLKPSNCMRTTIDGDEDVIKLVDFGIAKALVLDQTKLTNANTPIGTADYMAYEQAKGEKTDHRADVWSTGVLIYELVSGLLPFRGGPQNPVYRILSILEHEPISLAASVPTGAIPDGLSEIVARALCKDVNQRFQSIRELRLAIEPLATNQTIVHTKPYPSPQGSLGSIQQTKIDRPSPVGQTELDPAHIISVDSPSSEQVVSKAEAKAVPAVKHPVKGEQPVARPPEVGQAELAPADALAPDQASDNQDEQPKPASATSQTNYSLLALIVGAVAVLTILVFLWSTNSTTPPTHEKAPTVQVTTHVTPEMTSATEAEVFVDSDTTGSDMNGDSGSDATTSETTGSGSDKATASETTGDSASDNPKMKTPPKQRRLKRSEACRMITNHIDRKLDSCHSGSKPPKFEFIGHTDGRRIKSIEPVDQLYKTNRFTKCLRQVAVSFDFKASVTKKLRCTLN